jgi:hypothetical protein
MIEEAVKNDRMFRRLMLTFFTALSNNKTIAQTKLANSVYRKSFAITTHSNDLIGHGMAPMLCPECLLWLQIL